jgi:beta-lactamase regulating signal transducer with metallopeptidase domain
MTIDAVGTWIVRAYVIAAIPLSAGWVLSRALRRQGASARHHAWAVSVAIALLSLVPPLALPRIEVPVLHRSAFIGDVPAPAAPPVAPEMLRSFSATPTTRDAAFPPWPMRVAISIWLIGMDIRLSMLLLRRRRLRALRRRAGPWMGLAHVAAHPDVIVPMVAGLRCPTILLPAAAVEWPQAEFDAILRHEQTHIARHDHIVAAMGDVVTIVYWLNPLAWVAAAALDRERERACDDEVLRSGVKPSDYADALVRVAGSLPATRRIREAVSMTNGGVQARVRDILIRKNRPSGQVPLSWTSTALLVALCTIALTSVRLVARAPAAQADAIAVTINGEAFTDAQLRLRDTDLSAMLVSAVDNILVVQRGEQLGYRLTDAQFESTLENIKAAQKITTDEQFDAALARERMTLSDLRRSLERQMIGSRVRVAETSSGMSAPERDRLWETFVDLLRSQALIDWKRPQLERAYAEGLARRQRELR